MQEINILKNAGDNATVQNTLPLSTQTIKKETVQLKLYIEKGSPTAEVASQFNFYYPYLKIEFYNKPFYKQLHASKQDPSETNSKSGALIQFNCNGIVNISNNRTVRELETDIASLGLYGQVLRKSGHMWIETILTNDWTLQHQNFEGEQISSLIDKGMITST